jgi:L-aspartate oxidase
MDGRTDIKRLYVCGEIAATGIMGANRLASNSLLECLVFANRAVEDSVKNGEPAKMPVFKEEYYRDETNAEFYQTLKAKVSEIMNSYAGIVRTEERLKEGLRKIEELGTELIMSRKVVSTVPVKEYYEDAAWRLLIVASLIMNPALLRKESRGGHYREDFPHADESYEVHSIQQMGKEITTAPVNKDYLNF